MALAIDSTDRQRPRVSLLESEARYRSLLRHAHDAILIADDAGCYVEANPAAVTRLGYSRETVREMTEANIAATEAARPRWPAFERDDVQRGEIDRLARDLMHRMLAFNRRHEPVREPIAMRAVVEEAVRQLRALLSAMVEPRVSIGPSGPLVPGDATALHQLLLNCARMPGMHGR